MRHSCSFSDADGEFESALEVSELAVAEDRDVPTSAFDLPCDGPSRTSPVRQDRPGAGPQLRRVGACGSAARCSASGCSRCVKRNVHMPLKDGKRQPIECEVIVIGEGPAGLVALCAAATDPRITKVVAINALASYVTDEPYTDQRLGTLAPGILRDVGDVGTPRGSVHREAGRDRGRRFSGREAAEGGGTRGGLLASDRRLQAARQGEGLRHHHPRERPQRTRPRRPPDDKKDEPIFEPGAKLTRLAGDGAGGEGPAWDPKLGVLTSGRKGIHQLTPTA